jgi:hypothetical protein
MDGKDNRRIFRVAGLAFGAGAGMAVIMAIGILASSSQTETRIENNVTFITTRVEAAELPALVYVIPAIGSVIGLAIAEGVRVRHIHK